MLVSLPQGREVMQSTTRIIADIGDGRYAVAQPLKIFVCSLDEEGVEKFIAFAPSFPDIEGYGSDADEALNDWKKLVVNHLDSGNDVVEQYFRKRTENCHTLASRA